MRGVLGLRGVWALERSGRGHTPRRRVSRAGVSGVGCGAFGVLLCLRRKLSPFISRIWTWWVRRSSSAPGEPLRAEDLSPLGEGEVAGDHGGAPFIALAEHLEEQFGAGLGQRHEAEFIDDEQTRSWRSASGSAAAFSHRVLRSAR